MFEDILELAGRIMLFAGACAGLMALVGVIANLAA